MPPSPVMCVPYERSQQRATSHALARAFDDDDWFRWLLHDGPKRYTAMRRFFTAAVRDCARYGRVDIAVDQGLVVGGAAWLPPFAYPLSVGRQVRKSVGVAASAFAFPRQLPIAARILQTVQELHPKEPHWYLAVLGVDPSRWRRGVGSQLIEPVLAKADADGLPAYLETQAERNLAFYGRHGFDVREELRVPGCPLPLWTMWRPVKAG